MQSDWLDKTELSFPLPLPHARASPRAGDALRVTHASLGPALRKRHARADLVKLAEVAPNRAQRYPKPFELAANLAMSHEFGFNRARICRCCRMLAELAPQLVENARIWPKSRQHWSKQAGKSG